MRSDALFALVLLALSICSASCTSERSEQLVIGPDGRTLATVAMLNGLKHGDATLYLTNGVKHGQYACGLKTGQWVEVDGAGDTITMANYALGRAHGLWQRSANGRPVYLAYYSQGTEEGPRIEWYPDGSPASLVRFVDGKEQGTAHYWNQRDTLNVGMHVMGEYVDGKLSGVWRRYYADGVLCNENHYRNGLRHGIWTLWSRDGEVLRKIEYRFDKKVRTIVDKLK